MNSLKRITMIALMGLVNTKLRLCHWWSANVRFVGNGCRAHHHCHIYRGPNVKTDNSYAIDFAGDLLCRINEFMRPT